MFSMFFLVNAFKKTLQASVFTSICPIVLRDLGADGTTLGRIQGFKEPSRLDRMDPMEALA